MPIIRVPLKFICPLTKDVMNDPVATSDGQVYERAAIAAWLNENNTIPYTDKLLADKRIVDAIDVRKQIQQFILENNICTKKKFLDAVNSNDVTAITALNYTENHVNAHDETKWHRAPLHIAAQSGHIQLAQLLLKGKAATEAVDDHGNTPLNVAAMTGQLEIAQLLLANNANSHTRNKEGTSPLCRAAFFGNVELIELLLKKNAFVEIRDKEGNTPLHIAAYNGFLNAVKVLVRYGASCNMKNYANESPLELATNSEIKKFLFEISLPDRVNDLEKIVREQKFEIQTLKGQLSKVLSLLEKNKTEDNQPGSSSYRLFNNN